MLEYLQAKNSADRSCPQLRFYTMLLPMIAVLFSVGCAAAEEECSGIDCKEAPPAEVDACSPEPKLYINEFMSKNEMTLADEGGKADDWIEIFNASDEPIDIGGFYISDKEDEPLHYQIPTSSPETTTLEAGGYILLWADNSPEEGILHLGFKLKSEGESITLRAPDGETEIDFVRYEGQEADISFGRFPDGCGEWWAFENPTPGAANR